MLWTSAYTFASRSLEDVHMRVCVCSLFHLALGLRMGDEGERPHSLVYAVWKHVLGRWSLPSGVEVYYFQQHLMTFACLVLIMTKCVQKENWLNICLENLYASLRKNFVRHCSLGWLILLCNWSRVSHWGWRGSASLWKLLLLGVGGYFWQEKR